MNKKNIFLFYLIFTYNSIFSQEFYDPRDVVIPLKDVSIYEEATYLYFQNNISLLVRWEYTLEDEKIKSSKSYSQDGKLWTYSTFEYNNQGYLISIKTQDYSLGEVTEKLYELTYKFNKNGTVKKITETEKHSNYTTRVDVFKQYTGKNDYVVRTKFLVDNDPFFYTKIYKNGLKTAYINEAKHLVTKFIYTNGLLVERDSQDMYVDSKLFFELDKFNNKIKEAQITGNIGREFRFNKIVYTNGEEYGSTEIDTAFVDKYKN